MVEDGRALTGCWAIADAYGRPEDAACEMECWKWFRMLENDNIHWWPLVYRHGPRIIGLCLAAAIAESEGD